MDKEVAEMALTIAALSCVPVIASRLFGKGKHDEKRTKKKQKDKRKTGK